MNIIYPRICGLSVFQKRVFIGAGLGLGEGFERKSKNANLCAI